MTTKTKVRAYVPPKDRFAREEVYRRQQNGGDLTSRQRRRCDQKAGKAAHAIMLGKRH